MRKSCTTRRVCDAPFVRPAVCAIVLATMLTVPSAFAKPEAGKIAVGISGGTDFPVGGKVHSGTTAPVSDLGPLNPALTGVAADLKIEKRSQKKVYNEGYNVGLDLSYGLSDQSEVFGTVRRNWNGKATTQVGNAVITANPAATPTVGTALPINGTFGKYKATDVEVGYRQYMGAGAFQPYGAVRGGVGFVDKINASVDIPDASIALANQRFYKKTRSSLAASMWAYPMMLEPMSRCRLKPASATRQSSRMTTAT
jgi:hypothetical protein